MFSVSCCIYLILPNIQNIIKRDKGVRANDKHKEAVRSQKPEDEQDGQIPEKKQTNNKTCQLIKASWARELECIREV